MNYKLGEPPATNNLNEVSPQQNLNLKNLVNRLDIMN